MKDGALVALVVLVVVVFISGVALVVGLRIRGRIFAGPARDDWNLARQNLSGADRLRVVWATAFYRPVGRGRLALAQLVYTRYAQDTAERSPLRLSSLRLGLAVLLLTFAAAEMVQAVASHGSAFHFVSSAGWLVLAVLYGLLTPRVAQRMPVKLKRLRRKIRERYPEEWA